MRNRLIIITLLVLCASALALPKVLPLLSQPKQPTSDAKADGKSDAKPITAGTVGSAAGGSASAASATKLPKASVQAVVVRAQPLSNIIRATGTLLAGDEVELHSEVAGVITQLNLAEGKTATKNTLLLKLNDADLQANLRKAQSREKLAKAQESRQKQLLAIKSISQNEYEIAVNELNAVKAEIDLIQAQIRRTEIRAPFDGVVGLKYISLGAYVTPTTRIANLVNVATLKIDFSIPGQYAPLVSIGDSVMFTLQGSSALGTLGTSATASVFKARIYAIEPKIDPFTRTMQIRAIFDNKARKVLPGSFAELELVLRDIPNAIVVPTETLIPELKGQRVFLARSGKAKAVPVETGIRTERTLQILSGVQAGDTVITTGLLQIRDGSPITVTVVGSSDRVSASGTKQGTQ
jgi:membrane fusion protein (multidrug efflux system)